MKLILILSMVLGLTGCVSLQRYNRDMKQISEAFEAQFKLDKVMIKSLKELEAKQ